MNESPHPEMDILNATLELPIDQRAAYLSQVCAGNSVLRARVEELLQAHEVADDFLETPAALGLQHAAPLNPPPSETSGDIIGRYKLLQQIGEGGCGIVYMAEQEEPVRRRVALKVIKLGMDTKQVIARFEAERQALALMDHPNIARVLDAGATETGRPYFVMELVRGTKITEFCDDSKLATEDRLKLIMQVCQAIQHAHQKGIIHRDIKPSNILVTINDGVPVPKVIDFGIAKATQGRLTDHTLFTAFEQFIGTPAYMSPEQAVLTSLDIDTRSDIYSLGVLLYELLTGRTPFDQNELLAAGLDEMRRTIREVEPVKPSTRLTQELVAADVRRRTAEETGQSASSPRRLQEMIHVLRGDLDWIVMKCLEKDRSRRYETANGLAADIGRYLKNEPIVARPPSKLYEFQKTVRRHRVGFALTTIIGLMLVLGVVGLSVSNTRIRNEQKQKEHALEAATRSEREGRAQLFTSLKSQAEARRYSHRIGQRLESLAALNRAAEIKHDEDLRDAAIATLAVPDLQPGPSWHAYDSNDLAITFDPDYKRYACINNQYLISVRTAIDGREIQRFSCGPAPQRHGDDRGFRFSPDGRLLAWYEFNKGWSVWEVETAQLILRTPPASSMAFAFSSDTAQLATTMEGSIVIFEVSTGKELKRWRFQHQPHALAFSPDNRQLAAGPIQSEVISIFDVEKGQLASELVAGTSDDRALAWHPLGKYLAVCVNEHILFWDVKASAIVSRLEGHAQQVTTLSFDPSGNWLIADSWDGAPRLWQPAPAHESIRFFSEENSLRFSKDGRWAGVIFPGDGKAQLLEFIPSKVYHTFVGSLMDRFSFGSISADGRVLALASKSVSIRELPGGGELTVLPVEPDSRTSYVHMTLFHPNGKELLTSGPRLWFEIWPIEPDATVPRKLRLGPPRRLPLPFIPFDFALARDGRTMAVADAYGGEARIMDLYTGTLRAVRFPHTNTDCVALSPDAQWLATSGWQSTQAQLWNVQTGERLLNVTGERARVTFTPDGRELVVSTPQAYVFYDVKTQNVTRRFQRQVSMHPGWIAFSPDGKLMAMEVSPGVFWFCEVASGRSIAHLQDPRGSVSRWMGFTPDGTQFIVAAGYEKAVHRWDLRAMRTELKAMDLDWHWPEFPPRSAESQHLPPLEVEVIPVEIH